VVIFPVVIWAAVFSGEVIQE
jgi:hypothetical protein